MDTFEPRMLDYAGPPMRATPADRAAHQVALVAGVFVGVLLPFFLVYYGVTSLVLTGVLSATPISGAHGVQLVATVLILLCAGYARRARSRWFTAGIACGAAVSVLNTVA